ncbi:MAG: DUF3810 domain-containing protein [Firmicutes bacterium]|nr:DUF3810 domain-containing protein [Bacillota bacterium]
MARWRGVLWGCCAALFAHLISVLAAHNPMWVERLYSRLLYPPLGRILSRVTSIVPISLAELAVVVLIATLLIGVIHFFWRGWRQPRQLVGHLRWALTIALFAYAAFTLLWGLNYHRQPLAEILGLEVGPASIQELVDLCTDLLQRTNELRQLQVEDENQVMTLAGGKWRALGRAPLGYRELAKQLPQVAGHFGPPKGVRLSKWWSYTGTAGMYFPFTGEANVNMAMPDVNIPVVACHELAHQRGFAREDEANYLAYLACINHPDVEFQYSGLFMALSQAMRALQRVDGEAFAALRAQYHPGLIRDLEANRDFWQAFSGPIEQLSERMNDAYLKSNRQADGVQSYGRMVDLLIAARRAANR